MADNNIVNNINETKVLIALTMSRGGKKVLVPSMEGYTTGHRVDGVAVINGDNAIIVALTGLTAAFGGTSGDLPLDSKLREAASPSMTDYDGEFRTDYIIETYGFTEGAAVEAKKVGWLPSGGEMALICANKERINALLTEAGGDALVNGDYWTSQMFSNDYPWFLSMEEGFFAMWQGQINVLNVRPVKSAAGYEEVSE